MHPGAPRLATRLMPKLMQRLIGMGAALALLSGCQTLIQQTENGNWIGIGPGSTLTLNQPISIQQDRARVFFVNGRARSNGANYQPSCALEVRRISRDEPQRIPAGPIRITRIQHYWTQVVDNRRPDGAKFRLAGMGGDGGDGGDPLIQTGFHLWLDEAADPNLMRLTCLGILALPYEAYPPTLEDIGNALGELATLTVRSAPD
jgi:hypothetical protein